MTGGAREPSSCRYETLLRQPDLTCLVTWGHSAHDLPDGSAILRAGSAH